MLVTRKFFQLANSSKSAHFLKYSTSALDISGTFPPIITPFEDATEKLSLEKLKQNLKQWNSIPFSGYVVQGSNGEYKYLSDEERIQVVKHVRENTHDSKILLAGSGCESTSATIEMTNRMADNGANAVLVISPFYYKNLMDGKALLEYYTEVANKSKVPVVLYNVPANTGINIPLETVVELSKHPNIIGIKDSSGDITRIGLTVHQTKNENFKVLSGSAGYLLASYSVGAVGGVCALANVLGNEICELHQLWKDGELEKAMEMQHRLIMPNTAITAKYGVPGLKCAMEWFGYHGGVPRKPLQPLSETQKLDCKKAFQDNSFL